MTKTIPLKSGSKYTIYTLNTANRKPWKREITYLAVTEPYKHFKAHRGTRIGRCYSRGSSVSLALISDLDEDIIIEGWNHADVISSDANKLIIEGGFGVGFSLSLQNLNRNYSDYKSLYFLDTSKDSEPTQVFPLQNKAMIKDMKAISEGRCIKVIKNISEKSTEVSNLEAIALK